LGATSMLRDASEGCSAMARCVGGVGVMFKELRSERLAS
jgi:hypothetical protein